MRMYLPKPRELIKQLAQFSIIHIPMSENKQADTLARMVSLADGLAPWTIMWDLLCQPSMNAKEEFPLNRLSTWINEVIQYLQDDDLPNDCEADQIKHKPEWFLWHDNQLYKESVTHPLPKCVTREEGDYILREMYQGAYESHQGGRTIAGKDLRASYYWPTLKGDVMT